MPFFDAWRAARRLRQRAIAYTHELYREPEERDVVWLATHATAGDHDRARWELRYARRALGVLVAQRDALDDKTGSAVAHAVAHEMLHDRNVAPSKLRVAERQFNQRLRQYANALAARTEGEPTAVRLGKCLLSAADFSGRSTPELRARAGEILGAYLVEANEALRRVFGTASLPEDVPPSVAASST